MTRSGMGPLFVNRQDETMFFVSSGRTVEESIVAYETELERRRGAYELTILEPASCPPSIAVKLRSALGLSVLEWGALKKRLPCVLEVGARVDLEPVLRRLIAADVRAEIRPSPSEGSQMPPR